MEKVTIKRVGEEKEVQTKFGLKKKQGVQFVEYGDIWHDVWASGLKVGETLEGTRKSREWQGKTYWNFDLPKKEDKNNERMEKILNKLTFIDLRLASLVEMLLTPEKRSELEDKARGYHYPTAEEAGVSTDLQDF